MATRLAIGTALKPVAPISGLIFFFEKRFTSFTKKIPPVIESANARNPPITIPIVVQLRNASAVIVAPTDSPRKMVAAFMILLEAASNKRNVLVPISFTRQKRLDEINHLKSKYGNSIDDILIALNEKRERISVLNDYDSYLQKLEQQLAKKEKELAQISDEVSEIRQRSAVKLVSEIKSALNDLNFLDVQFDMQFDRLPDYTANGIDAPEFLISTNPGEPLKPLGKVASGGELSRIMLGIKTIMAENDHIESLIFDEIDSGISGRTAQMVSEKMNELGHNHQIICITHLPQIAAMADAHFLIEKAVENKSTVSRIRRLTDNDSVAELARMLGGAKITDTVMESAREMKALAMEKKI